MATTQTHHHTDADGFQATCPRCGGETEGHTDANYQSTGRLVCEQCGEFLPCCES